MADYGITAFGAYVPRLRLERSAIAAAHKWMAPSLKGLAKGERAFCSWDEDAITMAVEAARDCFDADDRSGLDELTLASTTFPYASLQNSVIAAGALGLETGVRTIDIGGSQRAGVTGFVQALTGGGEQLFVATDALKTKPASTLEMTYGAGAAAFRIGTGSVIAKLIGSGAIAAQFIDHFRPSDVGHDYFWEERWIRDEGYSKIVPKAVNAALSQAGIGIDAVTTLVIPSPLRGAVQAVAKTLKFTGTIAEAYDATVGYCGTAHALLMLAGALESASPGDRILLIGFGQGAEAAILEVTDAITSFKPKRGPTAVIADKVVTNDYMRMLSFAKGIDLEWGMRAEGGGGKAALTTVYREADQLSAFVAGECGKCGTVQFPQLAYCVNPDCNAPADQFRNHPLTEEHAEVLTYTADWLSYYPAPPMYVGFVQFNSGARLLMETVDVGPEGIDRGTPLRIVFRIKEPDKSRGFNRYFWKATPVAQEA
jgi:3-hydroxy-3-methylglutaryl CoA synthase/uncharacterized OB-fold protein